MEAKDSKLPFSLLGGPPARAELGKSFPGRLLYFLGENLPNEGLRVDTRFLACHRSVIKMAVGRLPFQGLWKALTFRATGFLPAPRQCCLIPSGTQRYPLQPQGGPVLRKDSF